MWDSAKPWNASFRSASLHFASCVSSSRWLRLMEANLWCLGMPVLYWVCLESWLCFVENAWIRISLLLLRSDVSVFGCGLVAVLFLMPCSSLSWSSYLTGSKSRSSSQTAVSTKWCTFLMLWMIVLLLFLLFFLLFVTVCNYSEYLRC